MSEQSTLESVYKYQLKYGCNGLNCSNYFCNQLNFLSPSVSKHEKDKEIDRIAAFLANTHGENGGCYLCKYISPVATKPSIVQNICDFNSHLVFKENPEKNDFSIFKEVFNDVNTFQFLLLANNNLYLSSYDLSLNDKKCDDFRMMICEKAEYFESYIPLFVKLISEKFRNSKVKRTLHFLRGLIISTIFSQFICNTVNMFALSSLISMILKTDLILFCRQMAKMPRLLQNFVSVCHNAITILLIQDDDHIEDINRINQINRDYSQNSINNAGVNNAYLNNYYNDDALFFYQNALSSQNIGRGNIRSDFLHNICLVLQNLSNMTSKNDIFIHEQLTSYLNVEEEIKVFQDKRLFSFLYTPAVLTFEFRKKCYFKFNPINHSKIKVLNIRRNRIMTDAAKILSLTISDLEGDIRFRFEGENAMDFGGVRREFFDIVGKSFSDLRSGVLRKISNEYLWFYPDFEGDDNNYSKSSLVSYSSSSELATPTSSDDVSFSDRSGSISRYNPPFPESEYSNEFISVQRSLSYEQDYDSDDKIALAEVDESWFRLLGMLVGLCVRYQGEVLLNIKFPILLYKALIQKEITRIDLMEVYPDLIDNLEKLSHYTNDVFDQLDMRFSATTINHSIFDPTYPESSPHQQQTANCNHHSSSSGFDSSQSSNSTNINGSYHIVNEDLIKNGCEVQVTEENVHQYINYYFTFLLKRLLNKKYSYFYQGFVRVVGHNLCAWFNPEEISLMVSGEEKFDWDELVTNAIYSGGYNSESTTIFYFWDIFFNVFNLAEKKKLLFFITGLRGSPIGGLKTIHLRIERTDDVNYLPTAHTCVMMLALPDYQDKNVLENSLRVCLRNSEGFGFV